MTDAILTPDSTPPHPPAPFPSSDPPPPSPSSSEEGGSAANHDPASGSVQNVHVTDGFVEEFRVIGTQIENQLIQLYPTRSAVRRFACAEVEPVPARWEDESGRDFRGTDGEVDALLQHLELHRVLVLEAERGAGKVRTALYLGAQLRHRGLCTQGTLLVESLDQKVRVDIRHLAARDRDLRDRLVIFPNAFSRADPDVTRLFETTDRSGWQALGEQLRARGAYLVLTTDPADAGFLQTLPAQAVRRGLSAHAPELLAREMERRLELLHGAEPALLNALREGREWVTRHFRYVAQLAEFVDQYVELGVAGLALDEAHRRMRNHEGRILQDLDGDFEGWSFAFTLALSQCGGVADGVPWVDVDRLHRHVRQWLRHDLNLRYPDASGADADASADADTRLEFSDTRLLKRVRAEADTSGPSHTVRFRDGAPPHGMWEAMLTRHRRALLTVVPGLRTLAERGDEESATLRVLAARILGRIGEMDAERIVVPVMNRWANSPKQHWQRGLGALMDGALSSRSERYRQACVGHLQALQRTRAPGDGDDAHLAAVIAAWSWVGDHDLALAMRELGAVVHERLVPMIEDGPQFEHLLQNAGEQPPSPRAPRRAAGRKVLRGVTDRMYAQVLHSFLGVQCSVAALCATRGPVPVFTELRRWIADGGWRAGAVVAMMLLHERGIADQLKRSASPGCLPLAAGLAGGESEVRQTARFLEELFESLLTPFATSAQLQRFCLESLQSHLADWTRDALPVPEHAAAMRSLFESFLRSPGGVLREPLLTLLDSHRFGGDDPAMRSFATSVRV